MRRTDAVKLIYQGEFGSGHMIKNEAAALDRLRAEYTRIIHDETMPLYEYIGCGIARVNLAAVDTNVLPLERLNAPKAASASARRSLTNIYANMKRQASRPFPTAKHTGKPISRVTE